MRLFIFGAGFSGRAIARAMAARCQSIAGTTRSGAKLPLLRSAGMEPLLFDGTGLAGDVAERLRGTTHLVVSAAPGETGDPVIAAAGDVILRHMPDLAWIGYLSTIGVYGDHQGRWVDEETGMQPASKRSLHRVEAERAWLSLGEERGTPIAIMRLSGIYGPGRNAFMNLAAGTAKRLIKDGQVFNRIHVDDIAGATGFLAERRLGGVFNVSDDEPSPPQDVVEHAARLMGVEPPPEIPFEQAELSPMARSFWGETKRVSNARLKAAGYVFRHPDYRSALEAMWAARNWQAEPGTLREG